MTAHSQITSPDGVLVSSDTGTPSALEQVPAPVAGWETALEALEFGTVLDDVAALATGPLGAASVRGRRPTTDLRWIREELARVGELALLQRRGAGLVAEPVPGLGTVLSRLRIAGSVLDGPELLACRRTLAAARLVTGELRRVAPDAPRATALLRPLPDKGLERRLDQSLDDDGGVRDSASPALAAARGDIHVARERLVHRLEAMLRAVGGEGGVTLREGRYVIPVPRDLRQRPNGIIHGESASGATLYLEPAGAIPLGNALREAEALALREELRVLRDLTEMLRPAVHELRALHAMCVAVDDLAARARWAVARDAHAPDVAPFPAALRVVNGRHPLLLAAGAGAVPFDLVLEGPERTVLLSGPNTGGKSVLLKAVGIFVALAQCGIVPPLGPGSALPVFDRVFADIGDRQSIAANLSTFSAHLTLLREILAEAGEGTLVLLDEVGSGTDPAEGGALAGAALLALTHRGAMTFATTHLGALKDLATRTAGVVNASLQFDAATLQPSYLLVKGIPGRSYGIAIARRLGLPEDVLAEAESQVPDRERSLDALLATVEQREREQAARSEELAARAAEQDAKSAALEVHAEGQAHRETELRRRERDAERAAREQARQYLLEARETVEAAIAKVHAAGESAARDARRAVEQAAEAAAGAVRGLQRGARRGTTAETPAFTVGQRVRLESGTPGEVLEVRGDGRIVVRVGSLKMVADGGTLTPLPAAAKERARATTSHEVAAPDAAYEIDLRGMTGDEAEQVVQGALDAAILAEQPYLRIIHGKGTGVVRERVQLVLRRDGRVRTHGFAPANQGGTGVTVAEFAE